MKKSEKIKVDLDGDNVIVHYRRPDWEKAAETIVFNRENPPEGYRLEKAAISIRSKKGGRAVGVVLVFRLVSDQVDPFTLGEAYEFFRGSERPEPESSSPSA